VVFVVPVETGRLFDIGRMAQNIMVAARSFGLASCPVSFQDRDRLRQVLGLPDSHEGPHGVTLGFPAADAPPNPLQSPRLPLDELVHRDRW
jgi:nitroreductase